MVLRWGCQRIGVRALGGADGASANTRGVETRSGSRVTCGRAGGRVRRTTDSRRQRPRRRRRMASTRPPKTYSRSFRTGRRSEGSGGVVGIVRCAGCDAWPGSLRSSMRTSREACSGWGAVELSFLGAALHVSTHAPSTCTAAGGSGPEVPAAGAGPTPAPPESSGSYRARGRGRTPGLPPRGGRARRRTSRS